MLILKSDVTQNQAGTEVYVEVVEATGTYDVDDNPGGFGTPNPNRNALALVFYGNHKKVEADVESTLSPHNPLSVTSFTVLITESVNGVLEYYVFALPIFDDGGVYVDGDIVYDNETPATPFIKERVAGVWVTRVPSELVGKTAIVSLEDNTFVIPDAANFRNALNAARTNKLRSKIAGECGEEEYMQFREWFDYVDGELDMACSDFNTEAYAEAQIKVEAVLDLKTKIDGQY